MLGVILTVPLHELLINPTHSNSKPPSPMAVELVQAFNIAHTNKGSNVQLPILQALLSLDIFPQPHYFIHHSHWNCSLQH